MKFKINTVRLTLISCNEEMIRAVLEGDDSISRLLQVGVAPQWNFGGAPAFEYSLKQILEHPEDEKWMTYVAVLKSKNILIGAGGFKGKPDEKGMVEIGYGISESHRRIGYATEMANALIQFALEDEEVKIVMAHTLAEENASVKVLRKCGMPFAGDAFDPEDGNLWKWEIRKRL